MFNPRRLLLLMLLFALPLQGTVAASRLCLATLATPGTAADSSATHAHAALQHHASHDSDHASASPGTHAPSHLGHDGTGADDQASDTCSLCAACCLTVAVAPAAPGVVVLPPAFAGHGPVSVPDLLNVADGLERPPRTV